MRFVINRSDALGDLLLTLPMAGKIKESYPDARVAFVVSEKCRDLLGEHPWVDEIWPIERGGGWRLWKRFRDFSPSVYLHVGGSVIPNICACFLRIKVRGGLLSKWWSFLFLNKGVRQSRTRQGRHERDYNLEILKPLGMTVGEGEHFCPRLYLRPEEVMDFRRELGLDSFSGGMVIIHPGMSGHTVNWPSHNYGKLAVLLEQRHPGDYVYVFGYTPADEVYVSPIREYFNRVENQKYLKRVFFYDGSHKGLRHYMGLLSQASCVVAPSTGITHIANALGVGQIGLYGPIEVQSVRRWGPCRQGHRVKVFVPEVNCPEYSSCQGSRCVEYDCMERITPERVAEEMETILKGTP